MEYITISEDSELYKRVIKDRLELLAKIQKEVNALLHEKDISDKRGLQPHNITDVKYLIGIAKTTANSIKKLRFSKRKNVEQIIEDLQALLKQCAKLIFLMLMREWRKLLSFFKSDNFEKQIVLPIFQDFRSYYNVIESYTMNLIFFFFSFIPLKLGSNEKSRISKISKISRKYN